MQRHIFDGATRVSQKTVEGQPVLRWTPPTIAKGGNLVQAEPREESVLRQTVSQAAGRAQDSQEPLSPEEQIAQARTHEEAHEQGLLLGRQEGLRKGLEEGRQQGHEDGYKEGLAKGLEEGRLKGYKEGQQQADVELRQKLRTLNDLMTNLTHALNEEDYQLEQSLLKLVREVAHHVVQRELMIDSSHIIQIVRQALATLPPSRDNVRILVNPADLPLVQQSAEEGGENWRVIGNQHIARGGCRVETDQSAVDFTTSERFSQVIEQIANRQFDEDDVDVLLPPGETFEEAPQPVVKPSRLKSGATPRPGLIDEAAALATGGKSVIQEDTQDDSQSEQNPDVDPSTERA